MSCYSTWKMIKFVNWFPRKRERHYMKGTAAPLLSFLEGARNVVNSDDLISVIDRNNVHHLLACDNETYKTTTITLDEIPLQQGGIKSPYGNKYDKKNSYITVTANMEGTTCKYTYEIFLYDGIYAIGELDDPEEWNAIETGSVKPYTCSDCQPTGD